jgi:dienelactone hydrolase
MTNVRTITPLLVLGAIATASAQETLLDARRGFTTKLQRRDRHDEALEPPPASAPFTIARYRGPAGELTAYVSKPADPGRKCAAIIWITGGFPPGGAGASAWEAPDLENEQTAQAYRHAGLVMMYPTTRGTFGNAGTQESFLGEVDDVLAAADHLRTLEFVDPQRIYLGGHSTGGTLALLVAEATDRFAAVISFGPVEDPTTYGQENLPYDADDAKEARVRAPIHLLASVRSPTFVIEGEDGNIESLRALQTASTNAKLKFFPVAGATHFDVLGPVNALLARELTAGAIDVTAREVQAAFDDHVLRSREADDLESIADARRAGASLTTAVAVRHHVLSRDRRALQAVAAAAREEGFTAGVIESRTDRQGRAYFALALTKPVTLRDLDAVFAASSAATRLAQAQGAQYDGWDVP